MRNKNNRRRQDVGETKLKMAGERGGVGKRNKLLNFNDTEAVNVHIT